MAVYDKSGYSHSETSLLSVIYLSKKVRLPCLKQAHAAACFLQVQHLAPVSLPTPSVPLGQNRDLRGRNDHQPRGHQDAAIQDT